MRLLANPLVMHMELAFIAAAFAFVVGLLLIRKLREEITDESSSEPLRTSDASFPLETYHAVIQRLKDQEQELQAMRRAERERARASENISAALLSNLSSGVLLFNAQGLVQQANPAAREILGYASASGLHARDIFRGVHGVRREAGENDVLPETLVSAVERSLAKGESFRRVEADYVTPAGEERVLGVTVSPVRRPDGQTLGAACLMNDLTEISRLSKQVRLRENLASLGEMSAGIAHEFKNSLATISGYSQMLTREEEPAIVRDFAAKIHAETTSLARIVTDFLAFARPQALRNEVVDVCNMLDDCAAECRLRLSLRDVPQGFTISGDPTALRQAFSNLLRNSAEAARERIPVQVEVSAETDGKTARIQIRDNGAGIAEKDLSKIFIPFFTTKAQGTGLGLALVHRIVTEHGGSVAVASNGSGTTFTLSFPAPPLALTRAATA